MFTILVILLALASFSRGSLANFQPCTTQDGLFGECVPQFLCSSAPEELQTLPEGSKLACEDELLTCCLPQDKLLEVGSPEPSRCGVRNFEGLGPRAEGSEVEARFGEFPWMAAVLTQKRVKRGTSSNRYKCGGSLIHPQVVLTAASCLPRKARSPLKVRLGEWDIRITNETFPYVDVPVSRVVLHNDFDRETMNNNVALLVLARPVKLGNSIDVVCLPPAGLKFDAAQCTASGWGISAPAVQRKFPPVLSKVDLPVVSDTQCRESMKSTVVGPVFEFHESLLCAGGEPGRGACSGFRGSPLVCPVPDEPTRVFQAGIVSWGVSCGQPGVPGIYVSVASFRDWIDGAMKTLGFSTSIYSFQD